MQLQSSGYASNERKQIAKFDFPLKCCMFLFLGQKSLFLVGGLLRVEIWLVNKLWRICEW